MRDSYYARERKEAAYQARSLHIYINLYFPFYFFFPQAYLEEIKEIKDEEAKKKGEEVKNLTKTEETAEETKAENPAEESKDNEANILDSEAKKIILETTFENPTPTEIQQIVKNESKPLAEKKED